ncbi:hypothetical protein FJ934_27505 [Mesorhizobium sp. B2-4-12]|uniref:hypothetical protein n=1 Tax=Mesorhizobium sp. B2-4-12 TaxID=2589937 RepID=UPI00112CD7C4|nr:hypothetical protein [Mesorhizobium sp. B2-4-12]TPK84580.1 hypothetical protein FJ934_27505 [Mesorhizobium sp. B2-4-12]
MTFQHCDRVAADPSYVGIAIRATPLGERSMHVGLLYRHSNGDVKFTHLAWHNDLRDETLPHGDNYLWAECACLTQDDSLSDFVANFIEMCAQSKEIPYGPNPPPTAFDLNGRYSPQNDRQGLTCATFISSVLLAAGFPVVRLGTWESRPDDSLWWSSMMKYIEKSAPERAAELDDVAIEFRLRPDEVAVAATSIDPPLSYQEALARSVPLQELLFPAVVAVTDSPVGVALPADSIGER